MIEETAPSTIPEYKEWLKREHKITIDHKTKTYYESVSYKIYQQFINSKLWHDIYKNLAAIDQRYKIDKNYDLLLNLDEPEVLIKPFDSFILKSFRKNVVLNDNFPNKPKDGWILPEEWYSKVNDIVRTTFVVKYLDGVEYLVNEFKKQCESNNLNCNVDWQASEEGYYASHFYVFMGVEIPDKNWIASEIEVMIELQITTQLQEVIKKLLHEHYTKNRKKLTPPDVKWQWDYLGREFATNYLGHILHYVEGMIMDIREGKKNE